MHGQHSEDRQQKWHMWPGPSQQRPPIGTEADSACSNYFFKAGRKIGVGDCALFRADNAPFFIGIIRKLSAEDEGNLKLSVNWLYRLGDIKLGKGTSLEAAPNEIFYSFHKDEISAASLLHPCKVAFLQKGVELPSSVSSFVCRRVYDTANKCLYWLTDQDYTDEHQAEVNQLLDRTKHEMQAAAPSEGPSPRATNSPSPLKPETANASVSTQGKGKKRLRTDQILDSSKREKLVKVEDTDSKRECTMRFEDFTIVADKHEGLTNVSFVEQLFRVMLQERSDSARKPVDVMSHRTSLASIIAATEKEECLTHFVQLGGLRILNDWLQEAHKGKLGDGSPKEGDIALEELLLTLIRALEKLPVDLDALKNCIVGKSVNKLRSHRNFEIQKKARELVDTWKKRVNAEMKSSDEVKSGANIAVSWPSRPASETLSTKVRSAKSSTFLKPATNGSNLVGDTKINIQPISGHKELSGLVAPKENSLKSHSGAVNDILSAVKEEKSCSSSQSQNNSQSWCSGSGKGVGSWKEEAKTLSVAPVSNKTAGAMLRSHGHSTKSHSTAVTLTGLQKDPVGRHKIPGVEKTSCASSLEKGANEGARVENLNNQRLIVRLPNPGRSPSHSVSAGSLIDGSATHNRGSPPGPPSRHDYVNGSSRNITDLSSDNNGDAKCNGTSAAKIKEEIGRSCIGTREEIERKPMSFEHRPNDLIQGGMAIQAPSSSNTSPGRRVLDSVEGGIDLLASIAAREVSETDKIFNGSIAGEGQPISEDSNRDSAIKERTASESESNHQKSCKDGEKLKQDAPAVCPLEPVSICERDCAPVQEHEQSADSPKERPRTLVEEKVSEDRALGAATELVSLGNSMVKEPSLSAASDSEAAACEDERGDTNSVTEKDEKESLSGGVPSGSPLMVECQTASPSSLHHAISTEEGFKEVERGSPSSGALVNVPLTSSKVEESLECYEEDALEVARQVAKEVEEEVERYGKPEVQDAKALSPCSIIPRCEKVLDHAQPNTLPGDTNASLKDDKGIASASGGTLIENIEAIDRDKCLSGRVTGVDQAFHHCNDEDKLGHHLQPAIDAVVVAKDASSVKENVMFIIAKEESATTTGVVDPELESTAPEKMTSSSKENMCGSRDVERPVFDLNEGFDVEEVIQAATHYSASAPIPALTNPDSPSGVAAQSSPLAAPIAVVAATKGAFIPPSNLATTTGEVGWKGSAATSAFRPAEPRRMAETAHPPLDATAATSIDVTSQNGKQIRLWDIDLNVADERLIEDSCIVTGLPGVALNEVPIAESGSGASRPELDLNRVDGNDESMGPSTLNFRGTVVSPTRSNVLPTTAPRAMLDFDLNDGLGFEETVVEEVSRHSNPERSAVPVPIGMRQNSDHVNVAPWYNAASSMPAAMVMPAFTASRLESSYPVVAAPVSKSVVTMGHNFGPFGSDLYRGAAISSSAASYTASMPASFSYAGFPFGASFPFTAASYNLGSNPHISSANSPPFLTATPSQLVSAGAVVSPYGRPYMIGGIRDISGMESGASWVRPSLDLNSGPDVSADLDARDGVGTRPDVGLSQLSYQQAGSLGGTLKRKEPEGSFDPFRSVFKQTAWR